MQLSVHPLGCARRSRRTCDFPEDHNLYGVGWGVHVWGAAPAYYEVSVSVAPGRLSVFRDHLKTNRSKIEEPDACSQVSPTHEY